MNMNESQREELQGILNTLVDNRLEDHKAKMVAKFTDMKDTVLQSRHAWAGDGAFDPHDESEGAMKERKERVGKYLQALYQHKAHQDPSGLEKFGGVGAVTKADMTEGTGNVGGYLVPDELQLDILSIAKESSVFLPRCRSYDMKSDTKKVPALDSYPSVAWHNEGESITQTNPVLGEITLSTTRLDAYVTASNELLEDSAFSTITWLSNLFTQAMAQEVDSQILNGTGAPCSGILTAAAGASVVMGSGLTNFSSVTPDHLSDMMRQLESVVLPGSFFVANEDTRHHLRTLKDSDGNYLLGDTGRVWGLPFYSRSVCPADADSAISTAFLALCNPEYFVVGLRHGSMRMDMDPYTLLDTYKTRIRVVQRLALTIGKSDAFCRLLTAAA